MMITAVLILLLGLFPMSSTLTLQGNWTLTSVQSQNVSITAAIDQYVFRSSLIMNRIHFLTCNQLTYQVSVDQQNFWVNVDSELINADAICSQKDIAVAQLIRQSIRSVLTFDIIVDKLYLFDPSHQVLMTFLRLPQKSQSQSIIKGTWIMELPEIVFDTYVFSVDKSSVQTCNGTIYKYSINLPYQIKFQLQSGGCYSNDLDLALQSAKYYRKYESKLFLYDSKINLVAYGTINQTKITNVSTSTSQQVTQNSLFPTSLKNGNYILLLLYRRDLIRVRIKIIASSIQLTLCTKIIFNYSLTSISSIIINSTSIPNKLCNKADQSIYYNFLISAVRYSVDSDGLITLTDNTNKDIVSLVLQ